MKIWHPFTQHGLIKSMPKITSTKDAYLYMDDGNKIFDAISSWWVITHGHCHAKIQKAIIDAASQIDQIIFASITHKYALDLLEAMDSFLVGILSKLRNEKNVSCDTKHFKKLFFSDSGSTGVEVAIKMSVGHFYNKAMPRNKIIVMENSYHGDTIGAMSLGEDGVFNHSYRDLFFQVEKIPFPINNGENSLLKLNKIIENNKDQIAAIILEPLISGAGGMKFSKPQAIKNISNLCKENNIIVIYDEVMTGFGRTGTCFAFEQVEFVPDILILSKGLTGGFLPLAVTLCTEEIYEPFHSNDKKNMFYHSSSFTANPVACAAAIANIDIWKNENVLRKVTSINQAHKGFLDILRNKNNVYNLRKLGCILAFEIGSKDGKYLNNLGNELYSFFLGNNLLIRPLGNIIYMMPPYCSTLQQLTYSYEIIISAIDNMNDNLC